MTRVRVAVLASGGGSNLQAILDHLTALGEARHADVVLVASNRPDAGALARAERARIPRVVAAHQAVYHSAAHASYVLLPVIP